MGGRKSYPTKKFLGESKSVKNGIKTLKEYVENKEIKEVPLGTFNIFIKARKPIIYSAYSNKFFPTIVRNLNKWEKIEDANLLKRDVTKAWSKVKKKNKILVPKEVDRIIVENAVKILGGRK